MSTGFDFAYESSDIPEGMTVSEWRAAGRPSALCGRCRHPLHGAVELFIELCGPCEQLEGPDYGLVM